MFPLSWYNRNESKKSTYVFLFFIFLVHIEYNKLKNVTKVLEYDHPGGESSSRSQRESSYNAHLGPNLPSNHRIASNCDKAFDASHDIKSIYNIIIRHNFKRNSKNIFQGPSLFKPATINQRAQNYLLDFLHMLQHGIEYKIIPLPPNNLRFTTLTFQKTWGLNYVGWYCTLMSKEGRRCFIQRHPNYVLNIKLLNWLRICTWGLS